MKTDPIKHFLILIPVLILLVIQVPHLGLPYFFDEAWSYIPSIKKMAEAGPSLLPGVLPIDYCKGHPQLFFFISAVWMNLFHGNIIMMRILPLLFSIGVLVSAYVLLLKLANWESAMMASLLISVQSVFLAQSIFLLPEMLMTLLFVLSFFFFLNYQFTAYAIVSSLMVMTKETAIVFALTFGLFYLFSLLARSNRERHRPVYLLALATPGIIYAVFLLLHYLKFKMVFYDQHLQYISENWPLIKAKINLAYSFIFIDYGRLFIFMAFLISLIVLLFQRPGHARILLLGTLSLIAFMAFSVFNFYTQRYWLVLIVLFIILFGWTLGQLSLNRFIKWAITLALAVICLDHSLTQKQNADIDLGYVETIQVHQQLVHYCEENNLYDQPLSVSFNMIFCLKDKDLGYVTGQKSFTHVMDWKHYLDAQYFIYESTMGDQSPGVEYAKANFTLLKAFTNQHAWGYIYENTHFKEVAIQIIQ